MTVLKRFEGLEGAALSDLQQWLSGVDLRQQLTTSTFYRRRNALLPYGVDIAQPRPEGGILPAVSTAADCWDWLAPGDLAAVAELALADGRAVYFDLERDDPECIGTREDFMDALVYSFGLRLAQLARARGTGDPTGPFDMSQAKLDLWLSGPRPS